MTQIYNIHQDVISKLNKNGELLIAKLDDTENYFTITGISISLYRMLEEGKNLSEIESHLAQTYPQFAEESKKLFHKLIADLLSHQLIIEKK